MSKVIFNGNHDGIQDPAIFYIVGFGIIGFLTPEHMGTSAKITSLYLMRADTCRQKYLMAAMLELKMAAIFYTIGFVIIKFLTPENMRIAAEIKHLSLPIAKIWPNIF